MRVSTTSSLASIFCASRTRLENFVVILPGGARCEEGFGGGQRRVRITSSDWSGSP